ncbi:hypothetical protein Vadar_015905 [Vaccinium darrowii]|uniref:Uncharacterized protein n=1 Tax=Vaccinium darrowii TaxID=229202 RepID=A0ACB7YN74_9ERIC|nr:hypothetical protein Vadar_015905 [Vaccinium darrowii]
MDRNSSDNGDWIPVVKNTRNQIHGTVNHRYQGLHTLFVDNLTVDVGIDEIRELFNKFGVVRDVFIPLKRSKVTGNKFGFVRYDCRVSAEVAISKANGTGFPNRIQSYHIGADPNKTAEKGASFMRNNRGVGSYVEALAGHVEERKLASKMIDSVSAHEDQFSQVPKEAQSSGMGAKEDPNVSTLKSSQDVESFVEDSLGLQPLTLP